MISFLSYAVAYLLSDSGSYGRQGERQADRISIQVYFETDLYLYHSPS